MSDILNFNLQEELKKCKTPDDLLGKNGLIKRLTKTLIENMLEEEMSQHLGYDKYDGESKATQNSRNGKSTKKVRSSSGEIELLIPRDREGEFEPQVVKKHQRDISAFDDKIISMYAKGMTVRNIQEHILDIYGVEVSPTFISSVTDKVMGLAKEWQARPLQDIYTIVYFDAIHYKVKEDGKIVSKAVYTSLAIDTNGVKEVLGLWVGESEGATFWLNICAELKSRGVKDIFIACVDGLKGLPDAINAIFPKTQVQLCVVHMIRNSMRFIPEKHSREYLRELKMVYTAPSEEIGKGYLKDLEEKWGKKYPAAVTPWINHWTNVSPFFGYPPELRKIIYTTNSVEALHRGFRKITKSKAVFPTDDSLLKQLFLVVRDISKKWTKEVHNWRTCFAYFAVAFQDRLDLNKVG